MGFLSTNAFAQVNVLLMGGSGTYLTPDRKYFSPSGNYFLVFQSTDGNLVSYRVGQTTNTPIWNARSFGGKMAVLQPDGNFVIYNSTNPLPSNALFNTGPGAAGGTSIPQMRFWNDGSFEVINLSGTSWRSPADGITSPPGGPSCAELQQYPVCYSPGKVAQLNAIVFACSVADARSQAAAIGAVYGRCPGTL